MSIKTLFVRVIIASVNKQAIFKGLDVIIIRHRFLCISNTTAIICIKTPSMRLLKYIVLCSRLYIYL